MEGILTGGCGSLRYEHTWGEHKPAAQTMGGGEILKEGRGVIPKDRCPRPAPWHSPGIDSFRRGWEVSILGWKAWSRAPGRLRFLTLHLNHLRTRYKANS